MTRRQGEGESQQIQEEGHRAERAGGYRVVRYATPRFVRPECQRCHQAAVGEVNGAVVTTV